mmetsp:Transcript_25600/g.35651  ORF Transcript_25600/g.35651 Transcript_25600/m.35651 type:complete len:95 (-) Transcript_25600:156-440(-)
MLAMASSAALRVRRSSNIIQVPDRGFTKKLRGWKMNKIRIVQSDGSSFHVESPIPIKFIQEDTPLSQKPAWRFRQRKASSGVESFGDLFGKVKK